MSFRRLEWFGGAVLTRRHLDQWIWWVGPAAAALLYAALYNTVPPRLMTTKGVDAARKDGESPA